MEAFAKRSLLTGVDREPLWVKKATEQAIAAGLSERLRYQVGVAEQLPFDDNTFEMVACQTLLMHLRDPEQGLREMFRVARPGGLILVAEPTNLLGPVLPDAAALGESSETAALLLRFQFTCQQGKASGGDGCDVIWGWKPLTDPIRTTGHPLSSSCHPVI
jgi:ubiquinone/menaquinone biosynthesis C-methylase UbiE